MANEEKVPDVPAPTPTSPRMQAITIPLRDLPDPRKQTDAFCHRDKAKLTEESLAEVGLSLRREGQLEPVQVFGNEQDEWDLLTGHRRVARMYIGVDKGEPGFSLDMAVAALEVIGATLEDRLIRSVADNEVREKLDQKERLLVVEKFVKAGIAKDRAAAALAISVKSYERDARVATNPAMLRHVLDDHLAPGDASTLIQAAEKQGCMEKFATYFATWVVKKKAEIEELDRTQKAETGKGLKPAELLVKNHLTPQVFAGWLESIERGTEFTEATAINFEATLDKKSGKLRVERISVDTQEMTPADLAKLGAKLSQLGKRVLAVASEKFQLEQAKAGSGPQAAIEKDNSPYDMGALKEFNLGDVAEQIKEELSAKPEPNKEVEGKDEPEAKDGM